MHRRFQLLLLILAVGFFASCSANETPPKTLVLSLSADSSGFSVSDYQVVDQSFKKSHQQGNYQALLLDSDGNTLREITFQDVENSGPADVGSDLAVSIPLHENLHQISIFQLDRSSGHYKRPDESLVTWTLPEAAKEMAKQPESDY